VADQIALDTAEITKFLALQHDATIVVNRSGIITYANGQACSLFGYNLDELVGLELEMLLPEEFRAGHPAKRNHYFRVPHERPMGKGLALFGLRQDRSRLSIDVSLRPVIIESELHALAVIRDKSEIIAVQAIFEQRFASFSALSVSVEKLKEMIETQLDPIGKRVTVIEEVVPALTTRVEEVEKSMKNFGDQWQEIRPTFERIDRTFERVDNFAKHGRRILYVVGGLIGTSVITQLVASFFHIFGR
jgi:PAS domain S-box-containing protein